MGFSKVRQVFGTFTDAAFLVLPTSSLAVRRDVSIATGVTATGEHGGINCRADVPITQAFFATVQNELRWVILAIFGTSKSKA